MAYTFRNTSNMTTTATNAIRPWDSEFQDDLILRGRMVSLIDQMVKADAGLLEMGMLPVLTAGDRTYKMTPTMASWMRLFFLLRDGYRGMLSSREFEQEFADQLKRDSSTTPSKIKSLIKGKYAMVRSSSQAWFDGEPPSGFKGKVLDLGVTTASPMDFKTPSDVQIVYRMTKPQYKEFLKSRIYYYKLPFDGQVSTLAKTLDNPYEKQIVFDGFWTVRAVHEIDGVSWLIVDPVSDDLSFRRSLERDEISLVSEAATSADARLLNVQRIEYRQLVESELSGLLAKGKTEDEAMVQLRESFYKEGLSNLELVDKDKN